MNVKKLVPWNWFKDDEPSVSSSLPVSSAGQSQHSPLLQFREEIDRLFENAFRSFGWPTAGLEPGVWNQARGMMWKPSVDIAATDKDYTISVEVPGVDEDDVKLELVDNVLTIRGEKRQSSESKDRDFYRVERSYGMFQRVLTLPDDVELDQINAQFANGVLTINMPRQAVSQRQGKLIDIKKAACSAQSACFAQLTQTPVAPATGVLTCASAHSSSGKPSPLHIS